MDSSLYTVLIAIKKVGTNDNRAFAVAPGLPDSDAGSIVVDIEIPAPAASSPPSIEPASGTFANLVNVFVTSPSTNATICYTTDGSKPSCSAFSCGAGSTMYSAGAPIAIDHDDTVLTTIACFEVDRCSPVPEVGLGDSIASKQRRADGDAAAAWELHRHNDGNARDSHDERDHPLHDGRHRGDLHEHEHWHERQCVAVSA